jgi:hypothetical protein
MMKLIEGRRMASSRASSLTDKRPAKDIISVAGVNLIADVDMNQAKH